MKKLMLSFLGFVLIGILSAQTTEKETLHTKQSTNTTISADTVKTKPALKKKMVVVTEKQLNQRSSATIFDNNNQGKKEEDPSIKTQEEKSKPE